MVAMDCLLKKAMTLDDVVSAGRKMIFILKTENMLQLVDVLFERRLQHACIVLICCVHAEGHPRFAVLTGIQIHQAATEPREWVQLPIEVMTTDGQG
jgi:hypothetical protein